jgi:hypothetical protein
MIRFQISNFAALRLAAGLLLSGGAFLAPPFACAHSGDTTLARVHLKNTPEVSVEITVDRHQNPHIKGVQDIADALGKVLRIHLPSGKNWLLGDLAKPAFSLSSGYEHPCPVPLGHNGFEQTPELTTLAWTWRPSESPVRISVDPQSTHTVLLWAAGPDDDAPLDGWRILLAGDSAPPIPLPHPPSRLSWSWKSLTALGIAALGLLIQGFLVWMRFRARATS